MHAFEVQSAALHALDGRFDWLPCCFRTVFDFTAGSNDDFIANVEVSFDDTSTDDSASEFCRAGAGSVDVE